MLSILVSSVLLFLRSSSIRLHSLHCLQVSSIHPSIFPSITCFKLLFLCKTWPIQLAFVFIVCWLFVSSLTLCNTSSFLTWSVQLISPFISFFLKFKSNWLVKRQNKRLKEFLVTSPSSMLALGSLPTVSYAQYQCSRFGWVIPTLRPKLRSEYSGCARQKCDSAPCVGPTMTQEWRHASSLPPSVLRSADDYSRWDHLNTRAIRTPKAQISHTDLYFEI